MTFTVEETNAFALALAVGSGAAWLTAELAAIGIITLPASLPAGLIAAATALGSALLFALVASGGHLVISCSPLCIAYPSWADVPDQSFTFFATEGYITDEGQGQSLSNRSFFSEKSICISNSAKYPESCRYCQKSERAHLISRSKWIEGDIPGFSIIKEKI